MDAQTVASFVISRWQLDHAPASIMMQLICRGYPARKRDVLAIIRRYVDCQSENASYGRRR